MEQKRLRTYHRRGVTRESGYHTCEEATGGECLIVYSDRYIAKDKVSTFIFFRNHMDLVELFQKKISIIAVGGYIYSSSKISIVLNMKYIYDKLEYTKNKKYNIDANTWSNIGIHVEQIINKSYNISNVSVVMEITSYDNINIFDFISFDFGIVCKDEFTNTSCKNSFYQKTDMHIPYLYYLNSQLPINYYLTSNQKFISGRRVILKSCNRCGRYLPINIEKELKTLSFSLHCKREAPCRHSTFRSYTIQNIKDLNSKDLDGLVIEGDKLISYYGHQLECKACKKFFVNAPLNPQRNSQQFKEDSLRRRAIEVLINNLLGTNIIHFDFKKKNKKEFAEYIWKKFNKRCFKCGIDSKEITLDEMALDHTMPLAYLYRLDETATCLCHSHNSQKSDNFPVDYYSEDELKKLSRITGLTLEQLHKREVNQYVLELLIKNIVWFYDTFLMQKDYQKKRDGIKTADKINDSLKRVISGQVDLVEKYRDATGHYPKSVTIK